MSNSNVTWPSKTGNPSGGNRGNNPTKTSSGGSNKPSTSKK